MNIKLRRTPDYTITMFNHIRPVVDYLISTYQIDVLFLSTVCMIIYIRHRIQASTVAGYLSDKVGMTTIKRADLSNGYILTVYPKEQNHAD